MIGLQIYRFGSILLRYLHRLIHVQRDEGVIILDVGGGTIDVSAYKQTKSSYEEIAPAECIFFFQSFDNNLLMFTGSLNGSVFVTLRAEEYFKSKFSTYLRRTLHGIEHCFRDFQRV
jgi:hypothetical protein